MRLYRILISSNSSSNRFFFDQVGRNWENAWSQQVTPWETGTVTKPLIEFMNIGKVSITPASRALIPGCGSGHDCIYLANCGFGEVVGIDLSKTAIEKCNQNAKKHITDVSVLDRIKFQDADFFCYHNGNFDFIFDYLFFSALDKPFRRDWAKSMQINMKRGSGVLVTLMFPIAPSPIAYDNITGPPYPVTIEDYKVNYRSDILPCVYDNIYNICMNLLHYHLTYVVYSKQALTPFGFSLVDSYKVSSFPTSLLTLLSRTSHHFTSLRA